jgi:uncharacterized protein (TIGR02118 family)
VQVSYGRPTAERRRLILTVKIVALWGTPTDVDGFEKHYASTHLPLVATLPGLSGAVASKALDGAYYRMAELVFEDGGALQNAVGSAQGRELLADSGHMQETFGAKLDVVTVAEETRI